MFGWGGGGKCLGSGGGGKCLGRGEGENVFQPIRAGNFGGQSSFTEYPAQGEHFLMPCYGQG